MGEKKPDGGHGGFAFLTLDSCEVVDRICANKFHHVGPHLVDVKKAHPKDADLKLLSEQNNVEKNNNNPKGSLGYPKSDIFSHENSRWILNYS